MDQANPQTVTLEGDFLVGRAVFLNQEAEHAV